MGRESESSTSPNTNSEEELIVVSELVGLTIPYTQPSVDLANDYQTLFENFM